MGLDVIELIMDIEDRFSVSISDADAQRVSTVGDLYVFLLARTRWGADGPCPTGRACYRLRRTLTQQLGGPGPASVRPPCSAISSPRNNARPPGRGWPRPLPCRTCPTPTRHPAGPPCGRSASPWPGSRSP